MPAHHRSSCEVSEPACQEKVYLRPRDPICLLERTYNMKKVFAALVAVAAVTTSGTISEASGLFGRGCNSYGCGPVRNCYVGGGCGSYCCTPAPSCVTYETSEVTCYKTVYETHWKEVPVTCYKYVQHTDWVEKSCQVCIPKTDYVTKQVTQKVCRPVWSTVEKTCTYYKSVPVTTQETCVVDCGHWDVQYCDGSCCAPRRPRRCGGCGSCNSCCYQPSCCGHRVWVPNLVEKTYPCTKYVCKPYTKTVPVKVCHYEYDTVVRDVTYPVCTYEYVTKTYKVPVTRCETVPYETVKRVPYCVPKKVAYTVTVCKPVCTPCTTGCCY